MIDVDSRQCAAICTGGVTSSRCVCAVCNFCGTLSVGSKWSPPLTSFFFFFQAEDGIRDLTVTGVQTCALPIFKPGNRICISFTDITRATPNERLIPWLLQHLSHIPRYRFTLLNQLGTHRPNTDRKSVV